MTGRCIYKWEVVTKEWNRAEWAGICNYFSRRDILDIKRYKGRWKLAANPVVCCFRQSPMLDIPAAVKLQIPFP